MKILKVSDPEIYDLINEEAKRQKDGLEMIPSENYVSAAVRECNGSILTNKYSEGYPRKRYYGGNEYIDEIELIAQDRAKKLFNVPYVNVQPYSGSPANFEVYTAVCQPGDTIMGLALPDGGHLTHGWKASATAKYFNSVQYHVKEDGRVDLDEVWKLVKKHKPKLIWTGATAYTYQYEFDKFADIADSVGAYYAADIAHVAGLVLAGVHTNPVPYAHIVTTTTHKTLRGPRGGMIMITERGMKKDPELGKKVDMAVFPGLQGGPHDHQTAAIATMLKEASTTKFREYGKQIVLNCTALADGLRKRNIPMIGNGSENHLLLLNLVPVFGPGGGVFVSDSLGVAGITVNKNTIPGDPSTPFYPSGIRIGTPALTTRGMKVREMGRIANWVADVVDEVKAYRLPADKEERKQVLAKFHSEIVKNKKLLAIAKEIKSFCVKFPVP